MRRVIDSQADRLAMGWKSWKSSVKKITSTISDGNVKPLYLFTYWRISVHIKVWSEIQRGHGRQRRKKEPVFSAQKNIAELTQKEQCNKTNKQKKTLNISCSSEGFGKTICNSKILTNALKWLLCCTDKLQFWVSSIAELFQLMILELIL